LTVAKDEGRLAKPGHPSYEEGSFRDPRVAALQSGTFSRDDLTAMFLKAALYRPSFSRDTPRDREQAKQ
jgi:hypothetical protein